MASKVVNAFNGNEMNQMSSEELRKIIADQKKAQMTFYGLSKGKSELPQNPGSIRQGRKMIARAMTILVKRGERCV